MRAAAAAVRSKRGRRRRPLARPLARPRPLLLLVLLPVFLAVVAVLSTAAAQGQQDQQQQERREPLTDEGVDALVERFLGLVAREAALGEGDGEGDAAAPAATSTPPAPPPLDPSIEALLSRLLDEVLPDGAPEALRARTAWAMGVPCAPPPLQRPATTTTTETTAAETTADAPPRGGDPVLDLTGLLLQNGTTQDSIKSAEGDDPASPGRRRSRRRALLQNATPLSPIIAPASFLTVDRGGRFGGWAQSFQLIFSNIFDFFLRGGLGFLVPVIGDTLAPLRRYNWVRDLGMAIDAPIDNVINANYLPLPQTTDDLLALMLRLVAPFCAAERAVAGYQLLGALSGGVAELELVPWSCDVVPIPPDEAKSGQEALFENLMAGAAAEKKKKRKNKTEWRGGEDAAPPPPPFPASLGARQRVAWETCVPSRLVLRLRPATLTGPSLFPASYTGAACAFAQPFGFGSTFTLGLDAAAIALRLSRVGVDLTPTIVQFEGSGRFFPWIAAAIANNGSDVPVREVAFTSAANRTTGGG